MGSEVQWFLVTKHGHSTVKQILAGLSMLYSIVGVGLNAMPMAAVQDALTNMPLCLNASRETHREKREDDSLGTAPGSHK